MFRDSHIGWKVLGGAALLFGVGCGGTPGARPDDMSAEAHRTEAEAHDTESEEHAGQYDPNATRVRTIGPVGRGGPVDFAESVYNPTETHRRAGERHRGHAADHRAAAEELERFEEAECGAFPASTRPLCPLLGQVASVEPVAKGVRIHLAEDANAAAVEAHVRCHLAFARARGREGMADCPLYVEGARVEVAEASTVDLIADDSSAAEEIQQRTATHVTR